MKRDLAAQYRVLQEECGLWSNTTRALAFLTGEDRSRLLNGLVTCEVKGLSLGQGVRGFFTDIKGRILADVVVRAAPDRLWLDLPASVLTTITAHIEKYILVDRVEVLVASNLEALTVAGPGSAEALAELPAFAQIRDSPWGLVETGCEGHEILIAVDGHLARPAYTLWSDASATAEIRRHLSTNRVSGAIAEVDADVVEVLRVEKGIPVFGVDYGPDTLPQETGLADAVSYSKGCYLGQEVVARLHYRGQAARGLCRLQCACHELPAIGSRLFLDEREAGTVTSVARSPLGGEISGLAMVQKRATGQGTELLLEGGESVRVV